MNFYLYSYFLIIVIHLDQILYHLIWPLTYFGVNIRHIRGQIVQYFLLPLLKNIAITYLKCHVLKFQNYAQQ